MDKIVLIGAGGHCKVIIDIIKSANSFDIVGITDENKLCDEVVSGIKIIGNDNILSNLYNDGVKNAFICIGALNNPSLRTKLYSKVKKIGFNVPSLVSPNACVSECAVIGDGTCVMPGAIINSGAIIKENCIINSSSVVEHECLIEENTHISPNACVCGNVHIGSNCHIGAGSTVIQGINIGNNVTVGAGAVVIRDVADNVITAGVPAKLIGRR